MSPNAKDFYGKDVASAIKEACDTLNIAQENLDIAVIETGSTGIFGLIRKKAHIRVTVQSDENAAETREKKKTRPAKQRPKKKAEAPEQEAIASPEISEKVENDVEAEDDDNEENGDNTSSREPVELSSESLDIIRVELEKILELMTCPSTVTAEMVEGSVQCKVSSEFEEDLTGEDGRTLDSLQYLLRKIVSRKIAERVRLTIDVGEYRERRNQELRDKAIDYAALVKENGKTQVIASLNPSERRIVHVALQEDSDIRSRSVGDGLFKKVLIYKPGKGKNSGRRKSRPQNRKKGDSTRKKDS
ncbi:MAG: Jag N-terminal domain-containing protein [Desulfocapsaceae bacterium]|jgi:spoIIIJ-associated protein|nr:Jag N-terminal domain-containing protein [Desulfocapsaceae bacterium]